jgi:hypothetical protein
MNCRFGRLSWLGAVVVMALGSSMARGAATETPAALAPEDKPLESVSVKGVPGAGSVPKSVTSSSKAAKGKQAANKKPLKANQKSLKKKPASKANAKPSKSVHPARKSPSPRKSKPGALRSKSSRSTKPAPRAGKNVGKKKKAPARTNTKSSRAAPPKAKPRGAESVKINSIKAAASAPSLSAHRLDDTAQPSGPVGAAAPTAAAGPSAGSVVAPGTASATEVPASISASTAANATPGVGLPSSATPAPRVTAPVPAAGANVSATDKPITVAPLTLEALSSKSKAAAPTPASTSGKPATYSEQVRQMIAQRGDGVAKCYQAALHKDRGAAGRLVVRWMVLGDGRVGGARVESSTVQDPVLVGCIVRLVAAWSFPPPPQAKPILIKYPFYFQPRKS